MVARQVGNATKMKMSPYFVGIFVEGEKRKGRGAVEATRAIEIISRIFSPTGMISMSLPSDNAGGHNLFKISFAGEHQMKTFLEQNRHTVVDCFLFDLFSRCFLDNLLFDGFIGMEQFK
jgi:hypothetical protein